MTGWAGAELLGIRFMTGWAGAELLGVRVMTGWAGAELLRVRFIPGRAGAGLLAVRLRARCVCKELLFTLMIAACNGRVLFGVRASIKSDGEEPLGVGFSDGSLRTKTHAKVLALAPILDAEQSRR